MIPLHVHSNYSLLSGTVQIDKLITTAKKFSLPALALTDTNGMHGLISFVKKALEEKIKPLCGAYIDDPDNKNRYAIFLARNNEGYSELCKIITSRKLNDDFSLISILNKFPENFYIIVSSIELLKEVRDYKNIFCELIASKNFRRKNRLLYEFAKQKNINMVVTNPVYFLQPEDFMIHKTVTAIRLNTNIDNVSEEELADKEFYFKNPVEITDLYRSLPEAVTNTILIAENCNVDLQLNKYKFPMFPAPDGETTCSYLKKITYKGLSERYKPLTEAAINRLEYELSVVEELGYTDYFLVVWDIAQEAQRRGMMIIGRGSAANSIVSFTLGLTQVDPIKYNLYFERFLNKGRSSPPDVDLDFSWKERDEIIRYVFEKFGYENVAMISTTVTFRARSAFREVAKAFGVTNTEISKYSKFIPWTDAENLPHISQLFPESKSLNLGIEPWKSIVNIAVKIANFPRHLSIHPGGIVITPKPITNYTALEYAKNKGLGLIVTQPDMYGVEDLGLVKIDLLSQRSLGVLRDTMEQINNNTGS
jgi:DNA polymerase III alpha subunit